MIDISRTTVSLVLRIEDFTTGRILTTDDVAVSGDREFSLPIFKEDGYFVFTGAYPERITVLSKTYQGVEFRPSPESAEVCRISLIPTSTSQVQHPLQLPPGETVFIGLNGLRSGYTPAADIAAGAQEITMQKSDLVDITSMWHLLLYKGAADPEPVFITQNLGYRKYALLTPAKKDYTARGSRLIAMRRVVGTMSGNLLLPVPSIDSTIYIMETGGGAVKQAKVGAV